MKYIIRLEEFAMFAISIYGLYFFHQAWWVYLLLLIAPDISMTGYFGGNTTGAFSYNLFHHKGIALLLFFIGIFFNNQTLLIIGIILFGHASLDRMLGYGLKYKEGFVFTHLGRIGKQE